MLRRRSNANISQVTHDSFLHAPSLRGDDGGYLSSSASSSLLSDLASLAHAATGLNVGGVGAIVGGKGHVETVWLCKICGEEREMWRKSGAWFFKVCQYGVEYE